MDFIDHTGHIFNQQSFNEKPTGYEYEENRYIFWFDTEYGYKLSVNNYYFKPIRILYPIVSQTDDINVSISTSEVSNFSLLGSKQIQESLMKNETLFDNITLNSNSFKCNLTNDDVCIINNITEKQYTGYYKTVFKYNKNGKQIQYNGEVIERDDKFYGYINFGPLQEEVELIPTRNFYAIKDEEYTIKYISSKRELTEADYIDFNPNDTYFFDEITEEDYENTIILNSYNIGDDFNILGRGKIYSYVEIDNKYYICEHVYKQFALITFYCILYCNEPGTWETNVLININNDWCPITVGAEVVDECEELVINGKNMGISLPKDIIKAVYNSNYNSEYIDERLYNNKLKEYLMNLMRLRAEIGNFRSAIDSLKWFGWGSLVTLNKLWKTDNIIQSQYIRDKFDIINDNLYTYEYFRNSTFLSLSLPINGELKETKHDFNQYFWGESKPEMENYFDKMIYTSYDEGDIKFYRNYFNYTFDELGLKLCALKYYYNKYFLPLHILLHSTSMEHRCHMNDIKFMNYCNIMYTEEPIFTNNSNNKAKNYKIKFPAQDKLYFSQQTHFIDSNYCEFNNSYKLGEKYNENIFYINDTVINVPISFEQTSNEELYNCYLILEKDKKIIHECNFSFVQKIEKNESNYYDDNKLYDTFFRNFVIHPKTLNTIITSKQNQKYDILDWVNSEYTIYLCVNNIWYDYHFTALLPELDIQLGKLEYQYYLDTYEHYEIENGKPTLFNQINGFYMNNDGEEFVDFNTFMYQPDLVTINNTDFIKELIKYSKENNLTYINNEEIPIGKFYYYLQIENVDGVKNQKIIFTDDMKTILRSTDSKVYEILNNDDIRIIKEGDYRYSVLFKKERKRVTNIPLRTSLHNTLESYINQYYKIENNFISNKYLNRIHLFDIYDSNNKLLSYTNETTNADVVKLYKTFFDKNGTSILDKYNLNYINNYEYDTYLMHDDKHWYILLISVETIKNIETDKIYYNQTVNNVIDIKNKNITYNTDNYYVSIINGNNTYKLKYVKSDNQIMINRLQYVSMKNKYHFNDDDIIVCSLSNNKLPFKLTLGSKWTFTPMSINTDNSKFIQSPTEMAIISIGNENSKYPSGYYNITCNYSFDDFMQHGITKTARFRVNK